MVSVVAALNIGYEPNAIRLSPSFEGPTHPVEADSNANVYCSLDVFVSRNALRAQTLFVRPLGQTKRLLTPVYVVIAMLHI